MAAKASSDTSAGLLQRASASSQRRRIALGGAAAAQIGHDRERAHVVGFDLQQPAGALLDLRRVARALIGGHRLLERIGLDRAARILGEKSLHGGGFDRWGGNVEGRE